MIRQTLIILLFFLAAVKVSADPRWRMHTTFDGEVDHMFETPEYVYFTSRAMPDMNGERRMSLFRYDKEGDEIQALSTDNVLSSNTISISQYNPQKGYVVVLNNNYDISFLYDDGRVVTMPDYRLANVIGDKTVNSITIDPWQDRLYMATGFGYIAVNDEKYEISESRNYGESIASVARVGDLFLVLCGRNLYQAEHKSSRLSLNDYESREFGSPYYAAPLTDSQCLIFNQVENGRGMIFCEYKDGGFNTRQIDSNAFGSIVNNSRGVLVSSRIFLRQVEPDGVMTRVQLPDELHSLRVCSYDFTETWYGKERNGIKSYKTGTGTDDFVMTRDYMIPNSPSPFVMPEMVMHPTRGVMVPTYGFDYTFSKYPQSQPLLLSGYKDGWWTNYSPAYTNPDRGNIMISTNGLAVDPDNPDYVYITGSKNGIIRLNLSDSQDIIHMSKPADKDNGNPGFVEFVENQVGDNSWSCNFSTPRFDSAGNLWMVYADMDNQTPRRVHLYCWEAHDRQATTSSENIRLPKKLEVMDQILTNATFILPLKRASHKNILLFSPRNYNGDLTLIDTNGTPTEGGDDKIVSIKEFKDQDGGAVSPINPRFYWEDPNTGYVWICHSNGVCYFNPDDYLDGKSGHVYRIKVSRNDGTNLADYLLDGVIVNNITTDGKGRKWFGTTGGGIVVTSSDGRAIEAEINTGNSPIPSDNVYGMMYIPASNSMLIATSEGIAEYYLSGDSADSGEDDLKIYPNPVRPDYFGYVTIEGLPDRSLVKIVDASGNIVKEIGPVSGDVQWDVTNHQFKRVGSGVYFVLASAGENESSFSTVGKILVVN